MPRPELTLLEISLSPHGDDMTETWRVVNPGYTGFRLRGVHLGSRCAGRPCVIHNPTDHPMADYVLHYRDDRNIFERICPHGVGHPDPDQFEYWDYSDQSYQSIHGCDGCCPGSVVFEVSAGEEE
jgi:hypothetical protein